MKHLVGLFQCAEYDPLKILASLRDAVLKIRFPTHSLFGKTVLLKPNMLGAYPPEMGITTHPAFLEAAIMLFKELGCKVWVGDSANGIFPIDTVWERTGIRDVCEKHGVTQKEFEREGAVIRDGVLIAKPALEADLVVNLPKFKTHGLTVLTAAVKNLYGCVPGMQKTRYHQENIDRGQFAKLVVKIAELAKPSLNFVDGIVAMEGSGPSAGNLVKLGVVIAGTNHHAVDTVCARLIGLDPIDVDTLEAAEALGLWSNKDEIEIAGEGIEKCKPASFSLPATFTKGMRDWRISLFVIDKIWGGLKINPIINKRKCQICGMCVKACPVEAINDNGNDVPPKVVNKKCVQCYCCHEICPYKAVDLNESWGVKIGRFFGERRIKKRSL